MTAKTIFRPIWIVVLIALAAGSLACATFYEFTGLQPSRPRVQGPAAEVVDSAYYGDEYGYYYAGIVENIGSEDLQFVTIQADLKDAAGNLVASKTGYASLTVLASGERSPFSILFESAPGPWTSADLSVTFGTPVTVEAYRQFEVLTSEGHQSSGDLYTIIGELRNTGQQTADFVIIDAVLFDSANRFLGTAFTYAVPNTVTAGSNATFTINFFFRVEGGEVDHYELYIEGDPVQ